MRTTLISTLACCLMLGAVAGLGRCAETTPATARPAVETASRSDHADVPGHRTLKLEGWTIHVSDELRRSAADKTDEALRLLGEQLQEVARVIPPEPLSQLRKVPIWLSPLPQGFEPKGEYHPDVGWLKEHHRDPAMAKAIQFTNIPKFAAEIKRMPMMVLHELAHAYHDRVLGFENPEIMRTYEQAVKSGKYDRVQESSSGTVKKAYALTDHKEFFAELTEAYFGVNDFYPFNRAQLQRHDPAMYDLLGKLWQLNRQAEVPR
ncbi:MAG: hypothetical protein K2Y37_11780 [Pirellulales bacterium]|nr:hypothetical protein [Pirellulales bacterium]